MSGESKYCSHLYLFYKKIFFNLMEDKKYLTEQIITYLGNKRKLIPFITNEIEEILKENNVNRMKICDLFSGSGVVARALKQYASELYTNDLEKYSYVINDCYLTNKEDFNEEEYNKWYNVITNRPLIEGIITKNYAPNDDDNIKEGERVFYTHENAMLIDTYRTAIDDIPFDYRKFFLAPLLSEASIRTNTSGFFKSFYKSKKTNIGKFGGEGENALYRIKSKIRLPKPIFSNYPSKVNLYNEDANLLARKLHDIDITYIDPPYNEHPYGSNYFMLNTIVNNELGEDLSKVSGIPNKWNKSQFNKKKHALRSFEDLIANLDSKYILVSYNNEGIIDIEKMKETLSKYGELRVKEVKYVTFKGCRNRQERNGNTMEYLLTLKKNLNTK